MLKKLLTGALFAGFAAGLIAVTLHFAFVQPVLLEAERYESGDMVHFEGAGDAPPAVASEPETASSHDHGHAHKHEVKFVDGFDWQRNGLTTLFYGFTFVGYALVLVAGFALAEKRGIAITARSGMIWGLAGFVAVQLAPAFGLAPELPGNAAADIGARQIWWLSTVVATGAALYLIAFGRNWTHWVLATLLLLIPHIIGAPHPHELYGLAPPELGALFATRALGIGMASWVALGLIAGYIWHKDQN